MMLLTMKQFCIWIFLLKLIMLRWRMILMTLTKIEFYSWRWRRSGIDLNVNPDAVLVLDIPLITHEDDGGNWCCVWDRIYPEEEIETHSMPSLRRTSGFSWMKALCRADRGQELLTGLCFDILHYKNLVFIMFDILCFPWQRKRILYG